MTQKSFHWDGASTGDANTFTVNAADGIGYRLANEDYASPFVDTGFRMMFNGDENRGVLLNWLNELEVTGVGTPVSVNTGGAIVYGMPYENTAAVNVAVPSPTNDTRQDRIVLRRNWAAQTVRITRIAGVEGGGVPAMTQSPAPTGSGIYDVPLATLSITTGGVITVTDAREYCTYGGVPGADSIDTAQLTDSSIDWADRETRTMRYFLGGGCLEPALAGGGIFPGPITPTAAPTWNGGANNQAWQLNAPTYEGLVGDFVLPADYAGGDVLVYIWWVANGAIASTFYLRATCQYHYDDYWGYMTGSASTYIDETTVANAFYRTAGLTLVESLLDPDYVYHYFVYWYNSAGAEDINIMGLEFQYEGYV